MKAMISTLSLALSLAVATPAFAQTAPTAAPTAADADAFIASVEKDLFDYTVEASQVNWVNSTYLTEDTDAMASRINAVGTEKSVKYALEAAKYKDVAGLGADTKRKLDILRTGIVLPAPTTPGAATELNTIATDLQSQYGKGRGTLDGKEISGSDIEAAMGDLKHTPAQFAEMWTSWHDKVGAPMKDDYAKLVGIANAGAKELGFADTGAMWRSGYDMPPEEFAKVTEKIWQDMKPLYVALHTYVRWKLNEKYGDAVQAKTGPIRADLLGNMWAQEWGNI
ncbi:M2 family metallopeptidase, partial [Sphingopyxis sp.]